MGKHNVLKDLPESDRPYEKLLAKGSESLTDSELLAIILKTGSKNLTSLELAQKLLMGYHGNLLNLYELSINDLTKFEGIGKVKAIQLKAVAELSKRISKTSKGSRIKMNCPASIADYYMEQMRHLRYETLMCAYFDAKCNFLGDVVLSNGTSDHTTFSPRDVFKYAFDKDACQIILLHNHPSGDPDPSGADVQVTKKIRKNAEMLCFHLADHIIIGDNQYFSFKENNYI